MGPSWLLLHGTLESSSGTPIQVCRMTLNSCPSSEANVQFEKKKQERSSGRFVISIRHQGPFSHPEPMDRGLEVWLTLAVDARRRRSLTTASSASGISWNPRLIHQPSLSAMKRWYAALSRLRAEFLPSGKLTAIFLELKL